MFGISQLAVGKRELPPLFLFFFLMSSTDTNHDLVCVGSSPICLLEALNCAKSGGRALVIDAAERIGGAWQECRVFGFARAEIAPHVLLFNRATYDFFAKDLGVKMQRMTPPPRYVVQTRFGAFWMPYALSPFIAYFSVPLHYVRNPQFRTNFPLIKEEYFGRLGDSAKQLLLWIFGRRKPHIEYPAGGTLELLDRITERLDRNKIEVRTGTPVSCLEKLDDGRVRVEWDGGSTTTRQVCITRHQSIARFKVRETLLGVGYLPFTYLSVHLLVRMATPLRAAFIMAKRDPVVNLISDLTSYMEDVPAGLRLLVLRLHAWGGSRDAD